MEIVLNMVLLLMLAATMVFCWQLNKKIIELRQSKQYMLDLVKNFDNAVISTHKSIMTLKETSTNATIELRTNVAKAEELVKDLAFLNQTGTAIADNLENFIHNAKNFALASKKLLAEIAKNQDVAEKKVVTPSADLGSEAGTEVVAEVLLVADAVKSESIEERQEFSRNNSNIGLDFPINGDLLGEFFNSDDNILTMRSGTQGVSGEARIAGRKPGIA